jgi:superfamily II DNA or RNA helicase
MGIVNLYKNRTLVIVPTTKLLIEMQDKFKKLMDYES